MAEKPTFNKAGYTAIVAKAGGVLKEAFVQKLRDKKLLSGEDHTHRIKSGDQKGYAIAVYIKTSTLKKAIEKDGQLCALLDTEGVSLSDIVRQKSFTLGSAMERGTPFSAERYIRKTKRNESTFDQDRKQSDPSEWGDRIKKYGPAVGAAIVIGGVAVVGGRALNASGKLMSGVANDIVEATDIDGSGMTRDGLDKSSAAHSGIKIPHKKKLEKPAESHEEKEKERQETPEDKTPQR